MPTGRGTEGSFDVKKGEGSGKGGAKRMENNSNCNPEGPRSITRVQTKAIALQPNRKDFMRTYEEEGATERKRFPDLQTNVEGECAGLSGIPQYTTGKPTSR